MINIILDTNIWISFVAKDKPSGLLEELIQKRKSNEIILLTNEIILNEWKRNKEQTIKDVSNNIKQKYDSAKILADFLTGKERETYLASVNSFFSEEGKRIEMAINRVEETEALLMACEITPITDNMKLEIIEWALNKRAPFKNKKNSVGDALILISSVAYCKVNTVGLTDSIFVSFNHEDYSSSKDINSIHEELGDLLAGANMTFTRNIGEALHLAPQLISEINDYFEYQLDLYLELQNDIARGK